MVTSNNNCSYTLSLEAFAEKYTLFGGVRDQNKQPSNLDGLVLKLQDQIQIKVPTYHCPTEKKQLKTFKA